MPCILYRNSKELPTYLLLKQGIVYLLAFEEHGTIKIGSTRYPRSRIRAQETVSGRYLSFVIVSEPCNNYKEIEKELHDKFAKFRKTGEWFQCNALEVASQIDNMNLDSTVKLEHIKHMVEAVNRLPVPSN